MSDDLLVFVDGPEGPVFLSQAAAAFTTQLRRRTVVVRVSEETKMPTWEMGLPSPVPVFA